MLECTVSKALSHGIYSKHVADLKRNREKASCETNGKIPLKNYINSYKTAKTWAQRKWLENSYRDTSLTKR